MPKLVKIIHHGNVRWRVIVPAVGPGAKRTVRLFRARDEAELFTRELHGLRDGAVADFLRLSNVDRARLLHCLGRAGSCDALEAAVSAALAARPRLDKAIKDAVAECVDAKRRAGRSWQYVESLGVVLGGLSKLHGAKPVAELTSADIEAWFDSKKWLPETKLTYLTRLQTFFSFARKQGWAVADPSAAIERPTRSQAPPGILTVSECRALLDACRKIDAKFLPYFAIALFAGVRPDEVKRLTWSRVKAGHIEIESAKSKTRRRRLVEIKPALAAWLALGGDLPAVNWRRRWRAVRDAANVAWSADCLRHSFCSYSLPIHGAAWTALQAGHSESILFGHYRELVTREEAERFWALRP